MARLARAGPAARAQPISTMAVLASALAASGCSGPASTLDPGGLAAQHIANLSWLLIVTGAGVYILVLAALALATRRRAPIPPRRVEIGVVVAGIGMPLVILVALLLVSVRTLAELTRPEQAPLVVEVVGRQYWWALRYRDRSGTEIAATASELHLPQGRRVELRLRPRT